MDWGAGLGYLLATAVNIRCRPAGDGVGAAAIGAAAAETIPAVVVATPTGRIPSVTASDKLCRLLFEGDQHIIGEDHSAA